MNRSIKIAPTPEQLQQEKDVFKAQQLTKVYVIKNIENDIKKINLKTVIYNKIYFYTFVCFISSLIGVLLLLYGLAATVLFNSLKPNSLYSGLSSIFFIPIIIWIKVYFIPSQRERIHRLNVWNYKRKTELIRRKKRAIQKGLNHKITVDDEYVHEDDPEPPREKYIKYSTNRGTVYSYEDSNNKNEIDLITNLSTNYNDGLDNGITNDYYHKHILYPHIYDLKPINPLSAMNTIENEVDLEIEQNILNKMKSSNKLLKLKKKENNEIIKNKSINTRNYKITLLKSQTTNSDKPLVSTIINDEVINPNIQHIDKHFLTDDNEYNRLIWGGTMDKYDGVRSYNKANRNNNNKNRFKSLNSNKVIS